MFIVSKLMEAALQPWNMLLFALVATMVLLRLGRGAWGRRIIEGACAAMLVLAVLPWDTLLLQPLEQRFAGATLPERVDGVIVLGGAIDPVLSSARGQPSLGGAAERLTAMVELARRYPQARLIYSGGSGSVAHPEDKEAPVARTLLASLGVDINRVVFEDRSRNTRENAVFSREEARPRGDETWLLVTSAAHMPRAVGAFRAIGWGVTAYPVDYQTTGQGGTLRFSVAAGLRAIGDAMHEWLGLAYYRLRGWTDSWYPAPL